MSVELERTAMAKMQAMQDFAITCYMDILHPVQNARGQLAAFPHIIDTIGVASLLGESRAPTRWLLLKGHSRA